MSNTIETFEQYCEEMEYDNFDSAFDKSNAEIFKGDSHLADMLDYAKKSGETELVEFYKDVYRKSI